MSQTVPVQLPLPRRALDDFADGFTGRVLRPSQAGYREAVAMYNGGIAHEPEVVVQPGSTADVVRAVRLAREHRLDLSVKGGGHGVAGQATAGRLVVDLSGMRGVQVDAEARVLHAQGGCTWVDVDTAALQRGFATPGGRVTHTGVGGLTLGGGQGWLSPKYGLVCDNLLSAEVVTADGTVVLAGPDGDEELLWALRGGGGGFGVVTRFDYRLHDMAPVLLAGLLMHPTERIGEVLEQYDELVRTAGPDLGGGVVLTSAPPAPFMPPAAVGAPVAVTLVTWLGDVSEGERVLAPLRSLGPPMADLVAPMPYTVMQSLADASNPPGLRNYWSAGYVDDLSPDVRQVAVDAVTRKASPMSNVIVYQLGEAANAVDEDATAFPHRDARWVFHPVGMWADPADDVAETAWVRDTMAGLRPFETGGSYLNNDSGQADARRVRDVFGSRKCARLAAVKRTHDPDDVFRHAPSTTAPRAPTPG